jgi:hypothetical protein
LLQQLSLYEHCILRIDQSTFPFPHVRFVQQIFLFFLFFFHSGYETQSLTHSRQVLYR